MLIRSICASNIIPWIFFITTRLCVLIVYRMHELAVSSRNTWTQHLSLLICSHDLGMAPGLGTFPLFLFGIPASIYGEQTLAEINGGDSSTSPSWLFAFIRWILRILRDFFGSARRSIASAPFCHCCESIPWFCSDFPPACNTAMAPPLQGCKLPSWLGKFSTCLTKVARFPMINFKERPVMNFSLDRF